ncbi:MAG: UvrD-helicase domain-containing protein, partial [Myxococcales bacterium]|nr:UvrD-helicase domain-containing protein [Myxococcales bacterium]
MLEELGSLGSLAAHAAVPDSWLCKNLVELARATEEIRLRQSVAADVDALEADLRELSRSRQVHWHWKGHPRRPFAPGLEAEVVRQRRDAAKAELDVLFERADADLAACLQAELWPVIDRYEELKQAAGKLDFLDLLLGARTLLAENPDVLAHYRDRYTHLFVDEFQDTDPLQAEILRLLADAKPGRLFVVGDPKQSIYRFRRADLAVYRAVREELAAAGARVLQLTTSFRSVPSLQDAVNASFEPVLHDYVALEHQRPEPADQPSIVALPVPDSYGRYGRMAEWRIRETYPAAVGAFVDWLLRESGWTVEESREDGSTERVPIAARHVCFLLRRFKRFRDDVTRPYVRALEARRIPHVLVGGRSFHEREEVLAVRNALAAIEWPEDELRVFATLRGPLFALGDDALLGWRHRVAESAGQKGLARLHPLRPLSDETAELGPEERAVQDALSLLRELHRHRNRRPAAETITRLLAEVRAHAGLAIWPTGEQALANVLRCIDLARRWERGGAPSFRAFVEHLESEAEHGEAQDAPVVEEGTEGVRIMTVHRAKGLEFPVVILVDPTCNAKQERASRHVDTERGVWAEPLCGCTPHDLLDAQAVELERDQEEADRLAYVAATRARDLLVLPVAVSQEPGDVGAPEILAGTWLEPLHGVAYRPELRFSLEALRLEAREDVGIRQQRILQADESGGAAEESERAHAEWAAARQRALDVGASPSLRVETVTAASAAGSGGGAGDGIAVEVVETDISRDDRPGGKRFGTLVHVVLERLPLGADADAVAQRASAHGRLLGATQAEIDAAAAAVGVALSHPLLRRAAASSDCRREVPVLLSREEGSVLEGVVDLAFFEEGAWTVVDFKTDRTLGQEDLDRYAVQVRLYAEAIARATG